MLNNQNNWSTNHQNQQVYQNNQQLYQPQHPSNYGSSSIPRSVIFGSFINSPKDIRPQDIPFDRHPAFFPLNNGNTIIVKYWDADSNLKTDIYQLVSNDENTIYNEEQNVIENDQNDNIDKLITIVDGLASRINDLETKLNQGLVRSTKSNKSQQYSSNYKEEGSK